MDCIELRKRTVFKRYHNSDIFNLFKTNSKLNKFSNQFKNSSTKESLKKPKMIYLIYYINKKIIWIKPLKK